jgi:hypothetical protein
MAQVTDIELEIADAVAECYADPLKWVMLAYPWGEPGALEKERGPDKWQREMLIEVGKEVKARGFDGLNPVPPIREAVASGHGIGKSTLVAWLVNWIMSTRPGAQGTVTANTVTQLETKTWASIQKWTKLSITAHWFRVTSERMTRVGAEDSWFCSAQTCREENSEAFAGQHAATSTSFYIFDEASAVPDGIFEVAEGGLTDGEPMEFFFGNPTRNTGKFHRVCFGAEADRWRHRSIDSRESERTNKALIEEWVADYGEDSDFVRVRVRGLPPSQGELQFIDAERVYAAQKREVLTLPDDPLVAGVDVSGGGSAWNVCRFRRGLDARSIPPIRIPGEMTRDRSVLVARLAQLLSDPRPDRKISAMFIDSAFGAAVVERLHVLGFDQVIEINFGAPGPDRHAANQRAYMWNRMKDWLLSGAIPRDVELETDLGGPGYHLNRKEQLVLESKQEMIKRGVKSPDDGDALCLTFAQHVAPVTPSRPPEPSYSRSSDGQGWMG